MILGAEAATHNRFPPQPEGTGVNFPGFVVARRSKMSNVRRSSFLELKKVTPVVVLLIVFSESDSCNSNLIQSGCGCAVAIAGLQPDLALGLELRLRGSRSRCIGKLEKL